MSAAVHPGGGLEVRCERMTAATRVDAQALLAQFLGGDTHYLASSTAYGDGGEPALDAALRLFLERPELGFVWLAYAGADDEDATRRVVGACVVCYAISTSRGTLVAKLDDVCVRRESTGRGVGTAMLTSLVDALASEGVSRIDSACHRDNGAAWRFYARLGFEPLDEERIALLI